MQQRQEHLALAQCAHELARGRDQQSLVYWEKAASQAFDPVPYLFACHDWQGIELQIMQYVAELQSRLNQGVDAMTLGQCNLLSQLDAHFVPEWFNLQQHHIPFLLSVDIAINQAGQCVFQAVHADGPAQLGNLLQHRLLLRNLKSAEFADVQVQRMVQFFGQWRQAINALAPKVSDTNIVILLDPNDNAAYREYTFLANYLGYSVVHSADLTVREGKVWLKSLSGLVSVHVILNWTGTALLDPLELPQANINGVIGLQQAIRTGNVIVTNPLHTSMLPLFTQALKNEHTDWPVAFWQGEDFVSESAFMRCYVLVEANKISVLPSGRIMPVANTSGVAKDVWVEQSQQWVSQDLLGGQWQSGNYVLGEHILASRTAENLFWLGGYMERAETLIRFMRRYCHNLNELPSQGNIQLQFELSFMHQVFVDDTLQYPFKPLSGKFGYHSIDVYRHTLQAMFTSRRHTSIIMLLEQFFFSVRQVHELIVLDGHRAIAQLRDTYDVICQLDPKASIHECELLLDRVMSQLLTFNGAINDTLTYQNGAFMLKMGQATSRIEQLGSHLGAWLNNSLPAEEQSQYLEILLQTHVSLVTFKRRNRLQMSVSQILALLLLDDAYPRSVSYQIDQLLALAKSLPAKESGQQQNIQAILWQLKASCHAHGAEHLAALQDEQRTDLKTQLSALQGYLKQLHEALQLQYFSHTKSADGRHRQGYVGTERDLL
jgi:uncharacterized alpha-E superfamily protein